jgi:succinylarginine dihydrolase
MKKLSMVHAPSEQTREVNFDGLVGPTHNYAGLSFGNVASMTHRGLRARPREAALQGLAKMKALADLGLPQAVLPPHDRPHLETLRRLGFSGTDAQVLERAARDAPRLLAATCSASAMWVANAATVTPSSDSADGRVHFTPANLISKLHRSIEPEQTARTLRAVFADPRRFAHHDPLPGGQGMGDEGAANHTRLAPGAGERGLHLFVYGHDVHAASDGTRKLRFPSRQAREASEAVARAHGLEQRQVRFVAQSPRAINAGVFHNDVIAVGNDDVFLYHEHAYERAGRVIDDLRRAYAALHPGSALHTVRVPARRVPLGEAVRSYLFNSQLVTLAPGRMALIAPEDCRENASVRAFVKALVAGEETPIRQVLHFDLRESMRNGGGPACLRLRVTLTAAERQALPAGVFINDRNYAALVAWVKKHYREVLVPGDLADPQLLAETRSALDALTGLLGLGPIYPFQH